MNETIIAEIENLLGRIQSGEKMSDIMLRAELEQGFIPAPEDAPWFNRADWNDPVITMDTYRHEVRLVALYAVRPGTGAFRRLVDGIVESGWAPVVICPFAEMEGILRRWGWREMYVGDGIGRASEWTR